VAACLFGGTPAVAMSRGLGPVMQEVLATLRDPSTQWMVFVCLAVYFVAFTVLQRRQAERCGAH